MSQPVERLNKPRAAWRDALSPEHYKVLFEEATERPSASPLKREKRAGTYICAACHLPLFTGEAKFESGTGWPDAHFRRPCKLAQIFAAS